MTHQHSSISQDLLNRNISTLNSHYQQQIDETQINQSLVSLPGKRFSSNYIKSMIATLQLLYNKETKNKSQRVKVWIDNLGFKVFTEERGVFQTIVFWNRDLFSAYDFSEEDEDFTITISLKEFLFFFEANPVSDGAQVHFFLINGVRSKEFLIQIKGPLSSGKIKLYGLSDDSMDSTFNLADYPTILNIDTFPSSLLPSFKSMEWNHKYIEFQTFQPNRLMISSGSTSDSVETVYSNKSFKNFQCIQDMKARYNLTYFKPIKKALEQSKNVTIMCNANKLLYIECRYEVENDASAEIAFYLSAQIEENDEEIEVVDQINQNDMEEEESADLKSMLHSRIGYNNSMTTQDEMSETRQNEYNKFNMNNRNVTINKQEEYDYDDYYYDLEMNGENDMNDDYFQPVPDDNNYINNNNNYNRLVNQNSPNDGSTLIENDEEGI